ncbi:hypothetical protein NVV94_14395 [Pseudomonas sp. LS1212]|uniref:hypothetical protein n=1 Tax=Pseudomonas sp. LS1212 TaxID=2972478 RepID=UPI00215C25AD|nr:hypothetical protein [Pseudomonas sp. LS1212]UVJ41895.1 hypothetical protein NVV94_14395 [Pseudomonas sp. LS1212]
MTRKLNKKLIKLLMVLLLFLVVAQSGVLMFKSESSIGSLDCVAAQSMQAEYSQADTCCPNIQSQVACSMNCAIPYAGPIAYPTESSLTLISPQNFCYTPFLGRMAVAPEPFPPKITVLIRT